jgi:hypothetical protein
MKWVTGLIILAAILACVACILTYTGLFTLDEDSGSTQFVAAGAFLMATAGWIVNNAVSLRLKLRDSSLTYLEVVGQRNDQAANLNKLWIEHRIEKIIADDWELDRFFTTESLDHQFFNSLRTLANSKKWQWRYVWALWRRSCSGEFSAQASYGSGRAFSLSSGVTATIRQYLTIPAGPSEHQTFFPIVNGWQVNGRIRRCSWLSSVYRSRDG